MDQTPSIQHPGTLSATWHSQELPLDKNDAYRDKNKVKKALLMIIMITTRAAQKALDLDQNEVGNPRESKKNSPQLLYVSGSGDRLTYIQRVPDDTTTHHILVQMKELVTNQSLGEDEEENDEHDSVNDNDEVQENDSGETESNDDRDNFVHPNLSTYKADDQEKEKEEKTNDDDEILDEEENQEDDDNVMGGEQEDEEDEEVYGDLNLNLDKRDAEMTDAQINQETEEDIDSILNPNVQSDIPVNVSVFATTETPSSDTIIPQPPILIIQSQQQTHDSTTTTTIPTITLPEIPNFASLFTLSSILGIVDNYLASKMKDAVNVAVQLQSNKLREETQAENDCGV
ncbi:hypothetical protein Tco_0079468 [Tanacetum coccineum]